jgi:hypothetical protein
VHGENLERNTFFCILTSLIAASGWFWAGGMNSPDSREITNPKAFW